MEIVDVHRRRLPESICVRFAGIAKQFDIECIETGKVKAELQRSGV
jgi:hypothetical protein